VQIFPGRAINAKRSNIGINDAGGFNNILVPPGSPYRGGARLGETVGLYKDPEPTNTTILQRVLLSTSGPGGNQLTAFDAFTFMTTSLFTSGMQPPQDLGVFVQPVSITDGTGEFVSP
jgi:hypothetical protein